MTSEQIETYEYCKKHLGCIEVWEGKLPFGQQKYGCGSGSPEIEYKLEQIHNCMHNKVTKALSDAKKGIEDIIKSL